MTEHHARRNRGSRVLALVTAAGLLGCAPTPDDDDAMGAPEQTALPAQPAHLAPLYASPSPRPGTDRGAHCAAPPPVLVTLANGSPYKSGDATASKLDKAREADILGQVQPMRDFTREVVARANRYMTSDGAKAGDGECAMTWLDEWAAKGALTDMKTHDAVFQRSLQLAGLAFAYAELRGLDSADSERRRRIETWLGDLGRQTQTFYDGLPRDAVVRNNNHRYWAGLAVAAIATVLDDKALWAWASESYRVGVCQVDASGALLLELKRGDRALGYTIYALEPLAMIAEVGAANGVDLHAVCGQALHRLVGFTLGAVDDPSAITLRTGVAPQPFYGPDGSFPRNTMAWVEFYDRRFPGRTAFTAKIPRMRPYYAVELGGDVTNLLKAQDRARK